LLGDALSFQMSAFFYTAIMQTEKLQLNNTKTNLPAKTALAMVVPAAAAAAEMLVVGSGRRLWLWRRSRSLGHNDGTNRLAIIARQRQKQSMCVNRS
jgi:hypothetical protein